MIPAELSILLHRALEARINRLDEAMAVSGWQQTAEPLHRVRVASRRVRAALGLVDSDLYPAHKKQSRRLAELTRTLGLTRELDVLVDLLEGAGPRLSGPSAWAGLEHALELLERRRDKARERMTRALDDLGPSSFQKLLVVPSLPNPFEVHDPQRAAWELLGPNLEQLLTELRDPDLREDTERLHALRIRVKRMRYGLEVLEDIFQPGFGPALTELRRIQNALGEHHDHALLEVFLWELHDGLARRNRGVLTQGVLELLGLVAETRRDQFERFQRLAGPLEPREFCQQLELALGLETAP